MIAVDVAAQSLYFTSGSVSNDFSGVTLKLQGPTNQTCAVEGLDPTNQTWETLGWVALDSTGAGVFNTTLEQGVYGFYRARTTNDTYYSTNAFGAVAGTLPSGETMIGNPFAPADIATIIPSPADGTTVYQYNNGYVIATYQINQWDTDITVGTAEGVIVKTPTNVTQRYVVSGLFTTNQVSRSIVSGNSIICSPLYQIIGPGTWQVDELNTNRLGGYSLIPAQTSGYSPQCTINRMIDTSGDYQTYTLTTNNVWQTGGTNTVVPLGLTEGFWINKPTNATWTYSLPIW